MALVYRTFTAKVKVDSINHPNLQMEIELLARKYAPGENSEHEAM